VKADVIVIGGGPNGLTAGALLAKRGLKTVVLERRDTVGGAAVTEEFHPGFRASTVAHTAGPFRASLVAELGLAQNGLVFEEPEPRVFAPLPDGRSLSLFRDPARTAAEIRRFSAKDADRWPEFDACLRRIAAAMADVLALTPPDLERPRVRDLVPFLGVGWAMRGLGRKDGQRLLRWGPMAVADFVQEWFETDLLCAVIAARGITGALAGPRSAGTTANLLLQAAASGGSGAGSTVLVVGGLGALTAALAAAARRFGADIRTGAVVERVDLADGRAKGVTLAGGETIDARAVVSSADLHRTVLGMVDPAALDPDELRRVRNFRMQGMASKVNLALSGRPAFKAVAGTEAEVALRGRIHIGPDLDSLERAFDDAKYGGISKRPYLDVTIPTIADPRLAPPGQHVMSVYVQYTPYRLKGGDWKAGAEAVATSVLATLEEYAPGLRSLVVGRQVLTPKDLEDTYGLTGGHPSHGEPALDQLFLARPLLGWGRYRTPVPGLYLCGAGTHPGGGVSGGPGQNAAREILKDLRA
jgi:phytoene dehydrogenase-like protein